MHTSVLHKAALNDRPSLVAAAVLLGFAALSAVLAFLALAIGMLQARRPN